MKIFNILFSTAENLEAKEITLPGQFMMKRRYYPLPPWYTLSSVIHLPAREPDTATQVRTASVQKAVNDL